MQKILPLNALLVPDNASRVFKGDIFDVYQWPQKQFDGTIKTFEMLKRPDTASILVVRDGQVLLTHDEQPGHSVRLSVPMGRVDETDESWLSAAKRELREETGLICSTWRLLSVSQPAHKIEWFASLFLAMDITEEGEQELDPGGEKITMEWRDYAELREHALSGMEPTLYYMMPLFSRAKTIEELIALPEFAGTSTDR
jgi:8-oxo-dGTP pyrophosphatase MutT (NUDIX family)